MINYEQIKNIQKLILVGDAATGKTNITYAFCNQKIPNNLVPTVAVQYSSKTITIDNKKIKLQIWDTAGQQVYRAMTMNHYRNMNGALVVFDLSRRKTFENLPFWLQNLEQRGQANIKIGILGHKSDIKKRQVNTQQAQQFAKKHNLPYWQTTTTDISTITNALTKFVTSIDFHRSSQKAGNIHLNNQENESQGCSC